MLADAPGGTGKVIETDKDYLAVSWDFPKGRLGIALNIGEAARPVPTMPGKAVFAYPRKDHPEKLTELPPNSILVSFEKA
ncbi:DUF3459 domain-containing protein [Aliirhizobium terrae]|uniref:DUF3459 domain-containing protein n=1 Tax=Terrirhizobium terrae TaxID=2926709 RepID=UPI0025787028|nr:DUF3459 domain-containing protein [Rhizobium sp. CC-CFT758]WJH40695.1 DUF3459 domain-containing protein [Rhizobium sp. CC-CFT758]